MKENLNFNLIYSVESNDNDNNVVEEVNVHIDWGGLSKTSLSRYPREVLKKIAYRLLIGSPSISVKVTSESIIHRYTEIKLDSHIFVLVQVTSILVVGMIGHTSYGKDSNRIFLPE